jgi:hypothetical protein
MSTSLYVILHMWLCGRWSFGNSTFRPTSSDVCDALGKALKNINDWTYPPSVEGRYTNFKPTYDWNIDNGQWTWVATSNGSQAWCEYDKTCNHRPWDSEAENSAVCEEPYQSGGNRSRQGAFFCASCEGNWCNEISTPSRCLFSRPRDENQCTNAGGIWAKDEEWQWPECYVDDNPAHTSETCMGTYCSAQVEEWEDWQGATHTWTSYGWCEWASVCHSPQITEEDCSGLRETEEDEFPRWYPANETEFDQGFYSWGGSRFWQRIVPAKGMCVYWAGYDDSIWNPSDTPDSHSTRALCETQGGNLRWIEPRYFQEGRWNTESSCKAGVCSSNPWDWELAKDPAKCTQASGICSRNCKACESRTMHQEFCVVASIDQEADCVNSTNNMLWSAHARTCYGTLDHAEDCFQREDATILSCSDLGAKTCDADGWKNDKNYNGEYAYSSYDTPGFGLSCYSNSYAVCKDETTCESGGTCNDW